MHLSVPLILLRIFFRNVDTKGVTLVESRDVS